MGNELRVVEMVDTLHADALETANKADTHEASDLAAHVIIPHDGQQTAMQADLLAKHLPDNEQRFD